MLFGECDRALRRVASNGRHPSLAKATTAPQVGAGSKRSPARRVATLTRTLDDQRVPSR
jgi:hypothetical protein